jgi:carboxymethylenebutenolidase
VRAFRVLPKPARGSTRRQTPFCQEEVVTALGIAHDVRVYPDAGHSFLNDHDPAEVPRWALVAGRFSASYYHEPTAIDARHRIVEFFATHLGSPSDA